MERVLEPELMTDEQQALAYAKADFSTSNQWYVDHLLADCADQLNNILDIGCGPGDVMLRLAAAGLRARVAAGRTKLRRDPLEGSPAPPAGPNGAVERSETPRTRRCSGL